MSEEGKLRRVVVLNRHGARAPSGAAYKPFAAHPLVKGQWAKADGDPVLEQLTSVGMDQCEAVRVVVSQAAGAGGADSPAGLPMPPLIAGWVLTTSSWGEQCGHGSSKAADTEASV